MKGPFLYDACARVPMIFNMPGTVAAGVKRDAIFELSDITPTLLDAANVQPKCRRNMQALSAWDLLTDASRPDTLHDDALCEWMRYASYKGGPGIRLSMLRDHQYKLVLSTRDGQGQLFDMQKDPAERNNLFHEKSHAATRSAYIERLARRLQDATGYVMDTERMKQVHMA
jgi:arylsulfatase A-like enzyme